MKNRGLVATIVIMSGIIVMLLVTLLLIKMPSIVGIKSIIIEKMDDESAEKETSAHNIETTVPAKKVRTEIMHYSGYNGNVDIEYPEIYGMDDIDLQSRLNYKIKTNALSIVPLFPISTALQKLDIYCDVEKLDDRYITILYTGKVIGKNVKETSTPVKKSSGRPKSTDVSGYDPYLNGFVDPLANMVPIQQNITQTPAALPANNTVTSVIRETEAYSLPAASSKGTEVFHRPATSNTENTVTNKPNNYSTADSGPTTQIELAPTKEKASNNYSTSIVDGNYSTNNPTSSVYNNYNNSSNGYTYPNSPTNMPSVPISSAPNNNQTGGYFSSPIYGYSGTNMSASTIDQNIFYTNTIDLIHCIDVPLRNFADVDKLAKYARSSRAELVNIEPELESEVREYIRKTSQSRLAEELMDADFRNVELKSWPKHFSYSDSDGNIYFTIKLSSKLGNYVIIRYSESS